MKKELTCIICPNGCTVTVETDEKTNDIISIEGYACPKGEQYARQEFTEPLRTVTSSVRIQGGELPLVSVRLTKPVPQKRIFDVMDEIKKITLQAPVAVGTVVKKSVLGFDSDLIATKSVGKISEEK